MFHFESCDLRYNRTITSGAFTELIPFTNMRIPHFRMHSVEVINMHEAKTHLPPLIEKALDGNEAMLVRAATPVAGLVPYRPVRNRSARQGV